MLFLSSCYTKKLKDNQYLLDKNHIEINTKEIDTDDLSPIIKQRPNRKILGILKFHLILHNIPDSTKVQERKLKKLEKKNRKITRKNRRKIKHDKDTIPHKTLADFTTFGEKLLYSIGEPPVILDTNLINQTTNQLHIYLIKKGFFDNTVTDSVHYIKRSLFKRKRSEVYYKIKVEEPYRIKRIHYTSKDSALLSFINEKFDGKKVKKGDLFDVEALDNERDRLSEFLLNNGYYAFNKNYIKFLVDSNINGRLVDVELNIGLAKTKLAKQDSVVTSPHGTYYISSVYVNYLQDETSPNESKYFYKKVNYKITGQDDVRLSLFDRAMHLKPGNLYSKQKQQKIFKDLTSYGLFKTIKIETAIDSIGGRNIKLTIILRETKKQEFRVDGNLTNSGGSNFGVEASTFYNHKNIFRGSEVFRIGFNGRLEYQPLVIEDNASDNSNAPINVQSFSNISSAFNTIEFGPETSITFPRLLFLSTRDFKNVSNAKTRISASLNYQRRINVNVLDYERGLQEAVFSYSWNVRDRIRHVVEPLAFSAIEVRKSEQFEARITSINDKLLAASFQNHIISATRYRFEYNELATNKRTKRPIYYSGSIESAGNGLRSIMDAVGSVPDSGTNSYSILGIQFAQYIKTAHDIRLYNRINEKSSVVLRFNGGIGIPMKNLNAALPFEKAFFAGGTDKLRAWKARSLGPGSFRDSTLTFDKIGEILLESNLEYRFDLLGFIDGAFFIDAGNIWLIKEDSLRPGSQFKFNQFAKDIAIGAGVGIRVDLDFFLLRFDLGFPVKNPSLVEGEKWFFQPKDEYNTWLNSLQNPQNVPSLYSPQFNIGIGYPF